MEPFYFAVAGASLFGGYYQPPSGTERGCGIVLCHPIGHEYIASHRAYRQLALRLCAAGFPVLRFDCYGCGDSAGDLADARLDRWHADVLAAIEEMRRRSGARKVSLIGARLGGTLAAACAGREDVTGLALWDAVIDGTSYLEALRAAHREMLAHTHVRPQTSRPGQTSAEIMGFPLSCSLAADISGIDLLAMQKRPAETVLVMQSSPGTDQGHLAAHLEKLGARVAHREMPIPKMWTWIEDVGKVLVPNQVIDALVAWALEACR